MYIVSVLQPVSAEKDTLEQHLDKRRAICFECVTRVYLGKQHALDTPELFLEEMRSRINLEPRFTMSHDFHKHCQTPYTTSLIGDSCSLTSRRRRALACHDRYVGYFLYKNEEVCELDPIKRVRRSLKPSNS